MRFFLSFLLLSSAAFAESPKAVISGPRVAVCGDRVILSAGDSLGETFEWEIECTPILPEGKDQPEVLEGGRKVYLPSYPGHTYTSTLVVAGIDDNGKPRASIAKWITSITGEHFPPVPIPPPEPVPPAPEPAPSPVPPAPAPDVLSGVAGQVKGWVESIPSPTRTTDAVLVASVVEGIAKRLDDGKITGTGRDLLGKVASEVTVGLTSIGKVADPLWKLHFGDPLGALVGQMFTTGQLNNADQWSKFLRDGIGKGLRAAK